jgi:hypothetical protein
MLSEFATPLRALLVALGGVFLAWSFFAGGQWIVVSLLIAVALLSAGALLEQAGRAALARDWVKQGFLLMESWILVPSGIAAVAAAIVIILGVALVAPESASSDVKALIGAVSTGVTAFLTTIWIDPSGKDADSDVSSRIQSAALAQYGDRDTPGSRLGQVLNEGTFADPNAAPGGVGTVDGWGYAARRLRAKAIAQELAIKPRRGAS